MFMNVMVRSDIGTIDFVDATVQLIDGLERTVGVVFDMRIEIGLHVVTLTPTLDACARGDQGAENKMSAGCARRLRAAHVEDAVRRG